MAKTIVQRGWLTASGAARYVGISPELIRKAMFSGELPAYKKPVTHGRTGERHNLLCRIAIEDIDAWVRTWEKVGEDA